MDQNLAAGICLIIISLAGFSYVIVTVSLYPEQAIVFKSNLLWLLLQFAVSLLCGILGGYIIGGHKETRRTARDSWFKVSWFFCPRMSAFCAFEMLYCPFSSDARVLSRDSRKPMEHLFVSAFWAFPGNLQMMRCWLARHVDTPKVGPILFLHQLHFKLSLNYSPTSRTDVTFFGSPHAGATSIAELHSYPRSCIYRDIIRGFYYTFLKIRYCKKPASARIRNRAYVTIGKKGCRMFQSSMCKLRVYDFWANRQRTRALTLDNALGGTSNVKVY